MATGAAAGVRSPQKSTARPQKSTAHKQDGQAGGLHMPTIPVPHVHVSELRLPSIGLPGGIAGRVVWFGGLATVAVFGVIDWPVAAVVAAGTWVAEQQAKQAARAAADRKAAR